MRVRKKVLEVGEDEQGEIVKISSKTSGQVKQENTKNHREVEEIIEEEDEVDGEIIFDPHEKNQAND